MGKRKQIIILVALLLALTARGWCLEEGLSREYPSSVDEKLERLQIYFETGLHQEAANLLDQLMLEYPDEQRFTYLRAITAYEMAEYEQAQKVFLQFIQEYPQVAEPYYLLGEISLKQSNFNQAESYFRKYCALIPEDYEAHRKLELIVSENHSQNSANSKPVAEAIPSEANAGRVLIQDGRRGKTLVEKIGFYGGCVHSYQAKSIKLINGSFCTWSSMGLDFVYPLDLRNKKIILTLKGKQGGEKLQLLFRDQNASNSQAQLVLATQEYLSSDWRRIQVALDGRHSDIDLSTVVHMGLEFGYSTAHNPAQSTLFVRDIVIEDADY